MTNKYVEFDFGEKYCSKKPKDRVICDTPEDFSDAGYILKSDELVVDIDNLNHETIRKIIEVFKIHTQIVWTGRGAHFYFKRPPYFKRAHGICALGFEVEYKQSDNTFAVTVKTDGKMREVENEGMRQQMPKILQPIRSKKSLLGMTEGDGRNNAIYEHKRKIVRIGDTERILNFINQNIFAEPLDDKEFLTVAREEVFRAEKDGENEVAERIIKEKRVKFFKNSLYFWDEDRFTNNHDLLVRMVYDYCPDQKTRYIDEVIKQMEYKAEIIPDTTEFKITLENGYLYRGEFRAGKYDDFTPYHIPIKYYANAKPVPLVDDYLDQLTGNDKDYRDFVLEVMATCLIVDHEFKSGLSRFFVFVGDGGNGKGTLLRIITKIIGSENVSASSIRELGDERYLNELIGKLANLGDDLENEPIDRRQLKRIKNLTSCDTIQVRRMRENAFSTRLTPTLIFTSNHILKTFDKDYSYKRRVLWCPMYIKPKEIDAQFVSKLTTPEALQYWMRLVVQAYQRLYENGDYTRSEVVAKFTEQYHRENDSTIEYLEYVDDMEIFEKRPPEVYEEYELWCENNGETVQSRKRLKEQILERGFTVKVIRKKLLNDGKAVKVYHKDGLKKEEDNDNGIEL